MSERNKLRLTVFEVALFLVVLAIGWATLRAFRFARQVDQIPVTFRTMPDDYFRIADYLEPSVSELNEGYVELCGRMAEPMAGREGVAARRG